MNSISSKTLEEKVKEVMKIHREISEIRGEGIRDSVALDKLSKSRNELERNIRKQLSNNKQISDPILDYCFRHFDSGVIDKAYLVKRFVMKVGELIGEKILSVYTDKIGRELTNSVLKTGVISGSCEFEVENSFRYLYAPIEKQFILNKDSIKWEEIGTRMLIESDIFKYPKTFFLNSDNIWETDHSKEIYIGGSSSRETNIYLGDKYVDKELKRYINKKIITETNIRISPPL